MEVDAIGRNCVMYAVHYSQLDTLQMLLENGADVNLQSQGLLVISVFFCIFDLSCSGLQLMHSLCAGC